MNSVTDDTHVCSHKHSFSLDNFLRKLIQSPKKILTPYIKNGDSVVDLGCGPGFFTPAMAELVGPTGQVLAVDLQQEMLDILAAKIAGSPYVDRIDLHKCQKNTLAVSHQFQADFILAYYMLHETPCQKSFFKEVRQLLKSNGRVLVVEPPFHVNKAKFLKSETMAQAAGFNILDRPKRKGGLSMLLTHS